MPSVPYPNILRIRPSEESPRDITEMASYVGHKLRRRGLIPTGRVNSLATGASGTGYRNVAAAQLGLVAGLDPGLGL